jgi:hypothetical protein
VKNFKKSGYHVVCFDGLNAEERCQVEWMS